VSLLLSEAKITDCGLALLIKSSKCSLQKLSLVSCKNITDEGIGQLAASGQLSNLDCLKLTKCSLLGDKSLAHIANGFPMLG
jgi:hypothetical protein